MTRAKIHDVDVSACLKKRGYLRGTRVDRQTTVYIYDSKYLNENLKALLKP